MGDIDWRYFVHQGRIECSRNLWLDDMGATGELTELRVRCECGASRFISEAAGKNNPALGGCDGSQQWLGPAAERDERCTEISRLLIRTASNAYFPQKLSVISMPDRGQELHAAVGKIWDSHLQAVQDTALLTVFKTHPRGRGDPGRLRRRGGHAGHREPGERDRKVRPSERSRSPSSSFSPAASQRSARTSTTVCFMRKNIRKLTGKRI